MIYRRSRQLIFCMVILMCISTGLHVSRAANRCTIRLVTQDDTGYYLPDVIIEVSGPGGSQMTRTSRGRSGLIFQNLPPGEYHISAHRDGFIPIRTDPFRMLNSAFATIIVQLAPQLNGGDPGASKYHIVQAPFIAIQKSVSLADAAIEPAAGMTEMLDRTHLVMTDEHHQFMEVGTRSFDSRLYLNSMPIQDPIAKTPFMLPPTGILSELTLNSAGSDSYQSTALGSSILLQTHVFDDRPITFSGIARFNVFNSSRLTDPDARTAYETWRSRVGDTIEIPDAEPTIQSRWFSGYLELNHRASHVRLAGEYKLSDNWYDSDYVTRHALETFKAWITSVTPLFQLGHLSFDAGFEDLWYRSTEFYRMRGYQSLGEHDRNSFLLGEFTRTLFDDMLFRFRLLHAAKNELTGPLKTETSFKEPSAFILPGDGNNLPDVPLKRRDASTLSTFQITADRSSSRHQVLFGMGFDLRDVDVSETFVYRDGPSGTPSDDGKGYRNWFVKHEDWELSLWGRDRWFALENFEITYTIRWDRYHYLADADHITPRIAAAFNYLGNRLIVGADRLVTPPALTHLFRKNDFGQTNGESPLAISQGFRWYAGLERKVSQTLSLELYGKYAYLDDPVITTASPIGEQIYEFIPMNGERAERYLVATQISISPFPGWTITTDYAFQNTTMQWPSTVSLYHLGVIPNSRFLPQGPGSMSSGTVRSNSDIRHSIHIKNRMEFRQFWNIAMLLEYSYASGRPFSSPFETDDEGNPVELFNDRNGPAWHRFDATVTKQFALSNRVSVTGAVMIKNIFNADIDPAVYPENGDPAFEPFGSQGHPPRTVSIELSVHI